ncbi:receptor-transporting protein 3-like [Osmerus mordax]|uniref:Receptor-transporting protein 3 n=1 Tax=Osmerus mordax TaxID=8014 RepID=C1BKS2_OSMMO|nr:Receptor-transporting protein 3 [Osmerus mordax]
MSSQDWIDIFQEKVMELNEEDDWQIEFDDSIKPNGTEPGWQQYITKTFAWFQCSKCKRKWPSSRVMVVFHMKLWKRQRKGFVKVRRLCQDCKKCTAAPMEKPTFSPDNLDILLEKLIEKIRLKCYHERTDGVNKSFRMGPVQSPHEPAHCEGCMLGICIKNAPGQANRF